MIIVTINMILIAINIIVTEKIMRSVAVFVTSSWEKTSREQLIFLLLGTQPVYCLYLFLYSHLHQIFFTEHKKNDLRYNFALYNST